MKSLDLSHLIASLRDGREDASTTYRPYLIEFACWYLPRQNLVCGDVPDSRLANPAAQALGPIKVKTKNDDKLRTKTHRNTDTR